MKRSLGVKVVTSVLGVGLLVYGVAALLMLFEYGLQPVGIRTGAAGCVALAGGIGLLVWAFRGRG